MADAIEGAGPLGPAPAGAHPAWCERRHVAAWPVHSGEIGEVQVGRGTQLQVVLHRYADDREPVVSLLVHNDDDTTLLDLTPELAVALADHLVAAVDALYDAWRDEQSRQRTGVATTLHSTESAS